MLTVAQLSHDDNLLYLVPSAKHLSIRSDEYLQIVLRRHKRQRFWLWYIKNNFLNTSEQFFPPHLICAVSFKNFGSECVGSVHDLWLVIFLLLLTYISLNGVFSQFLFWSVSRSGVLVLVHRNGYEEFQFLPLAAGFLWSWDRQNECSTPFIDSKKNYSRIACVTLLTISLRQHVFMSASKICFHSDLPLRHYRRVFITYVSKTSVKQ